MSQVQRSRSHSLDRLQLIIDDTEAYLNEKQRVQEQGQEDLRFVHAGEAHPQSGSEISIHGETINENASRDENTKGVYNRLLGKLSKHWSSVLGDCRASQKDREVMLEEALKALQQHSCKHNSLEVESEQLREELETSRQRSITLHENCDNAAAAVAQAKTKGSKGYTR